MRKAAFLLIISFAAMAMLVISIGQSLLIIQRLATVSGPRGDVQLKARAAQSFAPIATTRWVRSGDTIRTGSNGSVTLNWANGERVTVGPNTQSFELLKCQLNRRSNAETSLFKLDIGQVWVRVLRVLSGSSKFEIQTPTATAGVRGTLFAVKVTPDHQTTIDVLEGSVAVAAAGHSEEVGAGSSATAGQTGISKNSLDSAFLANWGRRTELIGPGLDITGPDAAALPAPGSQMTISGVAENDAKVRVNGAAVATNIRGKFTASVVVPSTPQFTVTVTAKDLKGIVTTRTLHYGR